MAICRWAPPGSGAARNLPLRDPKPTGSHRTLPKARGFWTESNSLCTASCNTVGEVGCLTDSVRKLTHLYHDYQRFDRDGTVAAQCDIQKGILSPTVFGPQSCKCRSNSADWTGTCQQCTAIVTMHPGTCKASNSINLHISSWLKHMHLKHTRIHTYIV